MSDLDRWLEISRDCKYLPENDLKQLCDLVCDLLLEESNIQPVSTPVTVCGDIHGQVGDMKSIIHTEWLVSLWHRTHRQIESNTTNAEKKEKEKRNEILNRIGQKKNE